jgi:hypothetical protein
MTEADTIRQAIADLCLRAGVESDDGSEAARDSVRAVVRRDRVEGYDRWQGWFRAATGLRVLVSTESVILLGKADGAPVVVAKVELPAAVRNAVREKGDGYLPRGSASCRPGKREQVRAACKGCGVARPLWVPWTGPTRAALLARVCSPCGQAARRGKPKRRTA